MRDRHSTVAAHTIASLRDERAFAAVALLPVLMLVAALVIPCCNNLRSQRNGRVFLDPRDLRLKVKTLPSTPIPPMMMMTAAAAPPPAGHAHVNALLAVPADVYTVSPLCAWLAVWTMSPESSLGITREARTALDRATACFVPGLDPLAYISTSPSTDVSLLVFIGGNGGVGSPFMTVLADRRPSPPTSTSPSRATMVFSGTRKGSCGAMSIRAGTGSRLAHRGVWSGCLGDAGGTRRVCAPSPESDESVCWRIARERSADCVVVCVPVRETEGGAPSRRMVDVSWMPYAERRPVPLTERIVTPDTPTFGVLRRGTICDDGFFIL